MNQLFEKVSKNIVYVDEWKMKPEDMIFKQVKGAIVVPASKFFGITDNPQFDYFILSYKRCYNNNDAIRDHFIKYINYFEKFYDKDHELISIYSEMKYLMDYEKNYKEEDIMRDIKRYILTGPLSERVKFMNFDNYKINLNYINSKNPELQYNNRHGRILMEISLFQKILIPILTHFVYVNNLKNNKAFFLKVYQLIIDQYPSVDIVSKLYETALSTVQKSADTNKTLWGMQNIRAKNVTTHSIQTVANILSQITPKYTYDKNIIHFNYKSVIKSTQYQVIEIGYEFNLKSLSSSKRDDDQNSEIDKFEAHNIKHDESLYIQNKVNAETTMRSIERLFGTVSDEEIKFYERELTSGNKKLIIEFQKNLIFNLFYKYFGDTHAANSVNARDYIKLMICAKKMLLANGMKILPYILSGKIERLVNRVSINKKELTKFESSSFYHLIEDKYRNDKISSKIVFSLIATILSSKFSFIDYEAHVEHMERLKELNSRKDSLTEEEYNQEKALIEDDDFNGKHITAVADYICEEILTYILLI